MGRRVAGPKYREGRGHGREGRQSSRRPARSHWLRSLFSPKLLSSQSVSWNVVENRLLCSLARGRMGFSSHDKGEAPGSAEVRVEEKSAASYFNAGVGDLTM